MGAGASFTSLKSEIREEWLEVFRAMKLQPGEVQKLLNIYNTIDADKGGSIDIVELLTFLDIERTSFTERIFAAFDKDHTNKVDFYEFVVSLWKFCTVGQAAIGIFTFDLYDSNADGHLTLKETDKLFRELLGQHVMEHEPTAHTIKELIRLGGDTVPIEVFRPYCKTHQALLLPVFAIQNKLKQGTLGSMTWESIGARYIEVHAGETVQLSELMTLHADRTKFKNMLADESAMRVPSIMRIVLENTNNDTHQPQEPDIPVYKAKKNAQSGVMNPFASMFNAFTAKTIKAAPETQRKGAGAAHAPHNPHGNGAHAHGHGADAHTSHSHGSHASHGSKENGAHHHKDKHHNNTTHEEVSSRASSPPSERGGHKKDRPSTPGSERRNTGVTAATGGSGEHSGSHGHAGHNGSKDGTPRSDGSNKQQHPHKGDKHHKEGGDHHHHHHHHHNNGHHDTLHSEGIAAHHHPAGHNNHGGHAHAHAHGGNATEDSVRTTNLMSDAPLLPPHHHKHGHNNTHHEDGGVNHTLHGKDALHSSSGHTLHGLNPHHGGSHYNSLVRPNSAIVVTAGSGHGTTSSVLAAPPQPLTLPSKLMAAAGGDGDRPRTATKNLHHGVGGGGSHYNNMPLN